MYLGAEVRGDGGGAAAQRPQHVPPERARQRAPRPEAAPLRRAKGLDRLLAEQLGLRCAAALQQLAR